MGLYTGHKVKIFDFLLSTVTDDLVIQGRRYVVSGVLQVQVSGRLAILYSCESSFFFLLQVKCLSNSVETYSQFLLMSYPRNTEQGSYMTVTKVTNSLG